MKFIPKFKFDELTEDEQSVILAVVRHKIKSGFANHLNYGLEKTEEIMIGMLEKGALILVEYDDNSLGIEANNDFHE